MFGKPVIMKCGHVADTYMTDVPYNNEKINVAACSFCFDQFGTAIQPACNVDETRKVDLEPLPTIKRDYAATLFGAAVILGTIIALIASI